MFRNHHYHVLSQLLLSQIGDVFGAEIVWMHRSAHRKSGNDAMRKEKHQLESCCRELRANLKDRTLFSGINNNDRSQRRREAIPGNITGQHATHTGAGRTSCQEYTPSWMMLWRRSSHWAYLIAACDGPRSCNVLFFLSVFVALETVWRLHTLELSRTLLYWSNVVYLYVGLCVTWCSFFSSKFQIRQFWLTAISS